MAPSLLAAALLLSFTSRVAAHGSLVVPPPRNAVERGLAPWSGPMPSNWSHHVDDPICPTSSRDASGLTLANGQSCFWLSHGCTIFCDKCDGVTGRLPHKGTCGNEKTAKATVCDPLHRTINRKAECGTLADFYYYNPWRAPGSAPTFDACGMAGGASVAVAHAGVGVRFQNTSFAKQGDLGSAVLPARPTGTVWKAGDTAEVSWTVRTNHGGGYQYRIASADGPLTEVEFQKTPLMFSGRSSLRWGGAVHGKRVWFDGECCVVRSKGSRCGSMVSVAFGVRSPFIRSPSPPLLHPTLTRAP